MTHLMISATSGESFRRCGHAWPKDGRIVQASDLSAKDLSRLKSEPMLHVREATAEEVENAGNVEGAADERKERIADAIASLQAEDFQRDGKPKLDSLNALLGDELGKISGAERDRVWEAMKENGFEAPTASS